MSALYPPGPGQVPAGLARPTRRFQVQAWTALAGLAAFFALYFGLTAWFGWVAWKHLSALFSGDGTLLGALVALPALFLLAVLVKGLLYVRRGSTEGLRPLEEADEPELVAFVRQVARDAGAPQPHRIFLSDRVNAGVFYDMSLGNLLLPSRKNLEIGLGLINALTLDEFKAVIAHEFGHFAQRTMTVGTWVYIARQFVGDLVTRRDGLDRFLDGISGIDLRVAWIGWAMRAVVWSIRSVLDTAFRGVVALERALARQMEFQADLVAVSVAGSDSLVHALHRLGAADDAWDRALHFAQAEAAAGRPPADVFALQARVLEKMRILLNDPGHGAPPPLPAEPAGHRVFKPGIADAPRMWASHPPNYEREENAKRAYLRSPLDDRPAWSLFRDPEATRRQATRLLLAPPPGQPAPAPAPLGETLDRLDALFRRPHLDQRYRGAWLGRELTRHATKPAELADPASDGEAEAVLAALDAAYPPELAGELARCRELGEEKAALEGIKAGLLAAPGGVIRFRGRSVRRQALGALLEEVQAEWAAAQARIHTRDRAIRAAHLAAARRLGQGWEAHLRALLALLHYVEHQKGDLEDAEGALQHVFQVAIADRTVTHAELEAIRDAGVDVQETLAHIHQQRGDVVLPRDVAERLGAQSWAEVLPERLELYAPSAQDIAQGWLPIMEGWARAFAGALGSLRGQALDALIEAEAHVARCLREGVDPGPAPEPARLPARYRVRPRGSERERSSRLGPWERFLIADGPLAGAARIAAASAILLPTLALSWTVGQATLVVHNGLSVPVEVRLDGAETTVPARGTARVSLPPGGVRVETRAADGREIESFEEQLPAAFTTVVYNVARASLLAEATVSYGDAAEVPPRWLGPARWLVTDADYVLEEPPSSISTKGSGEQRAVVDVMDDLLPVQQLGTLSEPEHAAILCRAHARWDRADDPALAFWLAELPPGEAFALISERIAAGQGAIELLRLQHDFAPPEEQAGLCQGHAERLQAAPDADATYLALRCQAPSPEQDAGFLEAAARYPDHGWLAYAAAETLARRGEFADAAERIEALVARPGARGSALAAAAASTLLRLRRVLAPDPDAASLAGLEAAYEELYLFQAAQADRDAPEGLWRALRQLQQGQLEDALQTPALSPEEQRIVTALVGLSAGASAEQIGGALELPAEILQSWPFFWPAVALAAREGRDVAALREAPADPLLSGLVLQALASPDLAKRPALLDEAVVGLPLPLRGAARLAGVVRLGAAAPEAWRREAIAFVVPIHRPRLP